MIKISATFLSTLFLLATAACFIDDNGGEQKNIKHSIDWTKPFNLVRLDLAKTKLPALDKSAVVKLQMDMWQKGVPINPAHFLPLPKEPTINLDEQEWVRFLEKLPEDKRPTLNRMMRNIQFLSYDELERALVAFARVFDELVGENYSIGFGMNKSSQWLASILLPYVKKKPKAAFALNFDTLFNTGTENDLILPLKAVSTDHLVIIDDGSYSGNQLGWIVDHVNQAMSGRTVIIFVAFATKEAMKLLEENVLKSSRGNRVIVVTTKTPMTAVRDVLSEEEFVKLFDATKLTVGDIKNSFEAKRHYSAWALVRPAWKTPDAVSFPDFLVVSQLNKEEDGEITVEGYTRLSFRLKRWNVVKRDDSYFLFLPQINPPYKKIALTRDLSI